MLLYITLKALFVPKIYKFCLDFFSRAEKRLDYNDKIMNKIITSFDGHYEIKR